MSSPVKRAAVLAAVLAMVASGTLTATAALPSPPAAPPTVAAAGQSVRITLITGDVVEIADAGSGRKAATVQPATGREWRY